jgi:hypothetical protein
VPSTFVAVQPKVPFATALPASSTATQDDAVEQDRAVKTCAPSAFATVHDGGPAIGSVDVATSPAPPAAAQNAVVAHETECRLGAAEVPGEIQRIGEK